MKTQILLLFLILLLASCSETTKQVTLDDEYGTTIFTIDSDSLKQGLFIKLDSKGDTIEKSNYLNDQLDGTRKLYNNGQLQAEESYENGVLNGEVVGYYPNGTIKRKTIFENNTMNGPLYLYYEDGTTREVVQMKNNAENGPFKEYYRSGALHWQGSFKNGPNENGLLIEFEETGDTIKKMMCGLYHGEPMCQTIWTPKDGNIPLKLEFDE